MEVPSPMSIHGAYFYLMTTIMAIAAVFAVYIVAVYIGIAPAPQQFPAMLTPAA